MSGDDVAEDEYVQTTGIPELDAILCEATKKFLRIDAITKLCFTIYFTAKKQRIPYSLPRRIFTRGWLLGSRVVDTRNTSTGLRYMYASILITPTGRIREVLYMPKGNKKVYSLLTHKVKLEDYSIQDTSDSFVAFMLANKIEINIES